MNMAKFELGLAYAEEKFVLCVLLLGRNWFQRCEHTRDAAIWGYSPERDYFSQTFTPEVFFFKKGKKKMPEVFCVPYTIERP